jgi:preprotein translocase subunit SecD
MSKQQGIVGLLAIACQYVSMAAAIDLAEARGAGCVRMTVQAKATKQHPAITDGDIDDLRQKIIKRIQALGIATGATQAMKNNQILIQAAQSEDLNIIVRSLSTTGELQFKLQKPDTRKQLDAEMAARRKLEAKRYTLAGAKNPDAIDNTIAKHDLRIAKLFQPTFIDGSRIKNALIKSESDGTWAIQIQLDAEGGREFAKNTKKVAGTGRSVGIFIDGGLVSMPIVDAGYAANGITGGYAVITGNFDRATASVLAVKLRTGALPVPVEIVSQGLYRSCPAIQ